MKSSSPALGWNFKIAGLLFLVGLVIQAIVLPSLSHEGSFKMQIAWAIDLLVAFRFLVAYLRKETGMGWIFYSLLCIAVTPFLEILVAVWLR
ncbi:MAG: hypothetical protein K8S55_01255 [Phycisphaerae bacterium]|nr:hypothetical protein [Phycisphaerae bacterium]